MMPVSTLRGLPIELRLSGAPPSGACFFDTNALRRKEVLAYLKRQGGGLISQVVFQEMLWRKPRSGQYEAIKTWLQEHRLRVVDVDPEVSETFWLLTAPLRFDSPPLNTAAEPEKQVRSRLYRDLLILATSQRHSLRLITNNTSDFQFLASNDHWQTVDRWLEQSA